MTEHTGGNVQRLLDAIDRMGHQNPDGSQADYECWADVWEARQAIRAEQSGRQP